jgi:hypothetical protein
MAHICALHQESNMRKADPRHVIDRMKGLVGLQSDDDLAQWISKQRTRRGGYKDDASTAVIRQTIANWRAPNRLGVTLDVVYEFSEWEGVTMEWLLFAEGPKFRSEAMKEVTGLDTATAGMAARLAKEMERDAVLGRTILKALDNGNRDLRELLVVAGSLSPDRLKTIATLARQLS